MRLDANRTRWFLRPRSGFNTGTSRLYEAYDPTTYIVNHPDMADSEVVVASFERLRAYSVILHKKMMDDRDDEEADMVRDEMDRECAALSERDRETVRRVSGDLYLLVEFPSRAPE